MLSGPWHDNPLWHGDPLGSLIPNKRTTEDEKGKKFCLQTTDLNLCCELATERQTHANNHTSLWISNTNNCQSLINNIMFIYKQMINLASIRISHRYSCMILPVCTKLYSWMGTWSITCNNSGLCRIFCLWAIWVIETIIFVWDMAINNDSKVYTQSQHW